MTIVIIDYFITLRFITKMPNSHLVISSLLTALWLKIKITIVNRSPSPSWFPWPFLKYQTRVILISPATSRKTCHRCGCQRILCAIPKQRMDFLISRAQGPARQWQWRCPWVKKMHEETKLIGSDKNHQQRQRPHHHHTSQQQLQRQTSFHFITIKCDARRFPCHRLLA